MIKNKKKDKKLTFEWRKGNRGVLHFHIQKKGGAPLQKEDSARESWRHAEVAREGALIAGKKEKARPPGKRTGRSRLHRREGKESFIASASRLTDKWTSAQRSSVKKEGPG